MAIRQNLFNNVIHKKVLKAKNIEKKQKYAKFYYKNNEKF